MTSLHNSLAEVTSSYTVFEKDQVLTEAHLNSVSNYLDDQDRLSRVQLIGVGIVCGLNVRRSGSAIRLTPGTGITSDGDLVRIPAPIDFDRFRPYDTDAPVYPPLYTSAHAMIPAFELVPVDADDPSATLLDQFASTASASLEAMSAVLLVESYIKDSDLCSGTDCDNRGQDYISANRLLLVPNDSLASLLPDIPSARAAAAALPAVMARRAVVTGSSGTPLQLNTQFVNAGRTMADEISAAFSQLWSAAGFLLTDIFASDPTAGWRSRLARIAGSVDGSTKGAQYFYEFMQDLVATWGSLRALMATDVPHCNPDPAAFAKHLVLGSLHDGVTHRFGFYPSAVMADRLPLRHLQFLAQKIAAMLDTFKVPETGDIRVTPSSTAESLEARAIPFYYVLDGSRRIVEFWNYDLTRRGMERWNYGYLGDEYGEGAAANPLQCDLARFDFFRIEGHVGAHVTAALEAIETRIRTSNLPFAVTSVCLGNSRASLVGKVGAGYTDLNRFHYLLRQDLHHTLGDVSHFNDTFKARVDQAVSSGTVADDVAGSDSSSVTQISDSKHSVIHAKTLAIQNTMALPYTQYRQNTAWMTNVGDAMTTAGEYKYALGKVVKTEYTTPFDNLIGSVKVDWLGWLDAIIDRKDADRDEKRLLREFIKRYPGMEHSGGVVRGGTFVLVYDTSGTVVADFMLSHFLVEEEEAVAEEPILPSPGIRSPWIIDNGLRLQPSLDHLFNFKLDTFKAALDQEWTTKFDLQSSYTSAFKDSIGLITNLYDKQSVAGGIDAGRTYQDATLGLMAENMSRDQQIIQDYAAKANDANLPQEVRDYYSGALDTKQQDLAKSAADMANYISVNQTEVSLGTDGYLAMQEVNNSMNLIKSNDAAATSATEQFTAIRDGTSNDGLAQMLGTMFVKR